jgi:hypothetical protein
MLQEMTIDEAGPKWRTSVVFAIFKRNEPSTKKAEFLCSIEFQFKKFFRFENAEPSMNVTFRGMTIDYSEECEKA